MSILLRNLMHRYMSPENGDGSGGGTGGAGAGGGSPANPDDSRETFSREYVQELRAENKGWRLKAQQLEQERDTHKTAAEKAAQDAEGRIKEANTTAEQRIIRAELKAAAVKAGMVDLDGLKLADLSNVKINEAGEVEGAEDLMKALKEAKPYLFSSTQSTSTASPTPNPKPATAKKATEMTDEEYARARAQIK